MPRRIPIQTTVRRNVLPCSVASCGRRRSGASVHCAWHRTRKSLYGSPLQTPIDPKTYAGELESATSFLQRFASHRGVSNARSFLQGWIDASSKGDSTKPAYAHVARIARHGVGAEQALAACVAVYLLRRRRPNVFRDDLAFTFGSSRAVLGLAPRDRKKDYFHKKSGTTTTTYITPKAAELRAMGRAIEESIGVLLLRAAAWIDGTMKDHIKEERSFRESLGARFELCPLCEARRLVRRNKYQEKRRANPHGFRAGEDPSLLP